MYMILRGLVTTIAPVLSFTAEEIYEAMPGEREKSVHLTEFTKLEGAMLSAENAAAWERIFRVREGATKVLERARAAQQIGQSLEADVVLHTDISPEALLGNLDVDLARLLIVSHVDFASADPAIGDTVEIEGLGRIGITMKPARGKKCGRCWQYREEVQEEGRACGRCEDVIAGLAPSEMPTA
jgi:isoleucyl-tRNA synthetase